MGSKIFLLLYGNNSSINTAKLHEFLDNTGEFIPSNEKFLLWSRNSTPNSYVLGTFKNTTWTVNKIIKEILTGINKNATCIVYDITDSPYRGNMPPKFWESLKNMSKLDDICLISSRSKKIKKIKGILEKKKELDDKERLIKQKKKEFEKTKSLKDREDRLNKELVEIENQERLLKESIDGEKAITPVTKHKSALRRLFRI